jgi:heat shock protein HtpX
MTLYTHTSANIRRTWLLMSAFLALVIGLGWIFSEVFQSRDILFFSVALAFFMNFLSYWFSDKIALAMHRAREVSREEAPELHRIVENLSITAGLPQPRIYIVEDPAPNAFATGRNSKHSVVAITTGLLERLERAELEGVLAHELSHIGNKDMLVGTVAVVLAGFISLLADFFLRSLWWGGRRDDREGGGVNPILLAVGIAAAVLAPIAAMLIQFAISRKREFLADASGALLTRYPDGLARALQKIGSYNHPMLTARTATAHLWLNDPFGKPKRRTSWFVKLFMTHPPIEERIAILRGLTREGQ